MKYLSRRLPALLFALAVTLSLPSLAQETRPRRISPPVEPLPAEIELPETDYFAEATGARTAEPTSRSASPSARRAAARAAQAGKSARRKASPRRSSRRAGGGGAGDDYYTNVDGVRVHRPVFSRSAPSGASAQCRDGSYSFSRHRRGTCSHHGGVARWL